MTPTTQPTLAEIFARLRTTPEALAAFCDKNRIARLRLFGSVVRDDFDPELSDVDVLVDFMPGRRLGLAFFGVQDDLSALFGGRKVDLVFESDLSPYVRPHVRPDIREVYVDAA